MTTDERHVSLESLDLLLIERLAPEKETELRAHLRACDACQALLDRQMADHQEFVKTVFPRTLPKVEAKWESGSGFLGFFRGWSTPLAALAAAACLAVVVVAVPSDPSYPPGVRAKGQPRVHAFVKRGNEVSELKPQDGIVPGDFLRFSFEPLGYSHVLVVGHDASKRVHVFYPSGGLESAPVKEAFELPTSLQIDDSPGPEVFIAVFSRHALLASEVIEAVLAAQDGQIRIEGAEVVRLSYKKGSIP